MGRTILLYFAIGLAVFFLLRGLLQYFVKHQSYKTETIGVVGAYTVDELPENILNNASLGLTIVGKNGIARPGAAKSWKIENNGKTYTFYLDENIVFTDNTKLASHHISYDFSDVDVERPSKRTVVFKLKEAYSPFLITVSKPIFKKGLVGIGKYKIKAVKLNGNFVDSIDFISLNKKRKLIYQFYPTLTALKNAFAVSDVSKIIDIPDTSFKNTSFDKFRNAKVEKRVNYKQLATLFYNTKDKNLSSKNLREALKYSIPDTFEIGERNYTSFSPYSFVYDSAYEFDNQDIAHSKLLIEKFRNEAPKARLEITLDTLTKYKSAAEVLEKVWRELGIKIKIRLVDKIPENFTVFLGEFFLSEDPDQYVLWHSDQINNITGYTNLRIDKILEDGRQTHDIEERKKIYADFQKYILADPPASFLFFPYVYDVTRK